MKYNCLLIDDDLDDHELFTMAVDKLSVNINLSTSLSSVDAVKKLKQAAQLLPDIIFLDLNMPKMNGIECLTAIKQQAHLSHIPVVMFTTSTHPLHKEETKRHGAADFLTKPDNVSTLVKMLEKCFDNLLVN